MRLEGPDSGRRNAKRLWKAMTSPEIGLWPALRRSGADVRFRRQHAAGHYVLDLYYAPAGLASAVDCEAHARGNRPMRDAAVTDGSLRRARRCCVIQQVTCCRTSREWFARS